MARLRHGYVKLDLSIFDTELFRDHSLFTFVGYLLWTASFRETHVVWEGARRKLLPGQVFTTSRVIAEALDVTHKKAQRMILYLVKREFLTQEVSHHGTILTICNWEKYQGEEIVSVPSNDPQVTHNCPTTGPQLTRSEGFDDAAAGAARSSTKKGYSLSSTVLINNTARARTIKGKEPSDGSKVWAAYAAEYLKAYNVPPVRNAKTNAICSQLVQRLGANEAPQVAAFYLACVDAQYVKSCHSLTLLLRDCEGLRTDWATGHQMTLQKARALEKLLVRDKSHLDLVARLAKQTETLPSSIAKEDSDE